MKFSCIFSNKYKFTYVVTPKVACSSIKRALLPLMQETDMTEQDIAKRKDIINLHKYLRNTSVHMYKGKFERRIRAGEFQDYFKFSFVRNPWDRLVSCYESKVIKQKKKPVPLKVNGVEGVFTRGMPFADFLRIVCDLPDDRSNVHFVPQYKILTASTENSSGLLVDFVGRFENLAEDFAHVMSRIDPARKIELGKWNVSDKRRDYRHYFNDELVQLVADRYSEDIEYFNYSF